MPRAGGKATNFVVAAGAPGAQQEGAGLSGPSGARSKKATKAPPPAPVSEGAPKNSPLEGMRRQVGFTLSEDPVLKTILTI
jgi:hypothetical protein